MVGWLFSKRPLETISRFKVCCLALLTGFRVLPPFCRWSNSAVFSGVDAGGGAVYRDEERGVEDADRKFVSNSDSLGSLDSFATEGFVERGCGAPMPGFSETG